MLRKIICLSAVGLILALTSGAGAQDLLEGEVMFEYWFGGGINNNLDTLKAHPDFPEMPHDGALQPALDHPDMADVDNWGARGRAFLTPPADGDYTFWVASDDDSELWLSTDEDPANAVLIANVEGWTNYQDYAGTSGERGENSISEPVTLTAGQRYYVELLFSDGTGGGHASVAWTGPDVNEPVMIGSDSVATDPAWTEPLYWSRNPVPADGAEDVVPILLEWEGGQGIILYDLYVGTTPDLGEADYVGPQQAPLYFEPLGFEPGQTYYWRADGIDTGGVVHESPVWSFSVLPIMASEAFPPSGAANAPADVELSWKAGQGMPQHNLYFGTDEALVGAADPNALLAMLAAEETSYMLPGLDPNTTYYWRVDEIGGAVGDVPGDVWSFSTVVPIESPVVEPNLVGLWTFDTEPANSMQVLDMTGNGRHGVIQGDIDFVDAFYMGPVLQLPGGTNQEVHIGSVGISGNDPTTIACWAKADNANIPDWTLIFGFTGTETGDGGNGSHFNIGSLGGPGGVGAHVWGWEETIFSDEEALEWHHYAMTYDGNNITYYGDGMEIDSDPNKSNVQDLSIRGDRVYIGGRITHDNSFPGMVDDCRVYDRALTADEVAAMVPASAPTIVFVSYHEADDEPHSAAAEFGITEATDVGYTDLLRASGYDVYRYGQTKNPDPAILNQADLVIISRTVSSGSFGGDGATRWNNIDAPMMILGGYVLRSSRMGFTSGTTMVDTTGDIALTITDPNHPIFEGVELMDGTMVNPFAEGAVPLPSDPTIISRGISINPDPVDDEGTVLATISEASAATGPVGGMVIGEWPAGATMENSSGSSEDVLGGPRLIFLTGSREPSGVTGGQASGLFDLYDDGTLMFLNAVDYMLNLE